MLGTEAEYTDAQVNNLPMATESKQKGDVLNSSKNCDNRTGQAMGALCIARSSVLYPAGKLEAKKSH